MELQPGQQIDHYTLIELLGEGGQGAVWKVLDPRGGGTVRALKLVSLADAGLEGFERAQREARILAGAEHPALVACHGVFEDLRAGLFGLVMDLVEGRSLAAAIDAGRLDPERVGAVIEQIAEVLAYIHGAGLVHRDLKPENVLLTEGFWAEPRRPGTVKLIDFGIAMTAKRKTRVTAAGVVIGTPPYLAPELAVGSHWDRAEGPARDVFAFGVLSYVLRFGGHPTGLPLGASLSEYVRAYRAADWPPRVVAGTHLAACLALQPEDRPRDGAEVLALIHGDAPTQAAAPATEGGSRRDAHVEDTGEFLARAGLELAAVPSEGAANAGEQASTTPEAPTPAAPAGPVATREHGPLSTVRDAGTGQPRVQLPAPAAAPPPPSAATRSRAARFVALVAFLASAGVYVFSARRHPAPEVAVDAGSAAPSAAVAASSASVSAEPPGLKAGAPAVHRARPPEGATCPPPQQRCGQSCTWVDHDLDNCGACGHACARTNGTATCTSGVCAIRCDHDHAHCDGLSSSGCETSVTTVKNCGACGAVCSMANARCADARCSCSDGFHLNGAECAPNAPAAPTRAAPPSPSAAPTAARTAAPAPPTAAPAVAPR